MGNTTNLKKFTKVPLDNIKIKGKIEQITCGWDHTLLITSENEIYGCGYNYSGNLGSNNKSD